MKQMTPLKKTLAAFITLTSLMAIPGCFWGHDDHHDDMDHHDDHHDDHPDSHIDDHQHDNPEHN
jgi:hypothetical protein